VSGQSEHRLASSPRREDRETFRLFVALELPGDIRARLARWAAGAGGDDPALRLAREEALHVTLAFLGHRPADEVDGLARAVREVAAGVEGPLALTLGDAAWFDPRRPRVLTVLLRDDGGGLAALYDELWTRLERLGHERERRRFRAHATVARVKHRARPARMELPPVEHTAFAAGDLTLFRSHLGGGRPSVYEALERARFGPARG
jgi:2'-5' RNA ligase